MSSDSPRLSSQSRSVTSFSVDNGKSSEQGASVHGRRASLKPDDSAAVSTAGMNGPGSQPAGAETAGACPSDYHMCTARLQVLGNILSLYRTSTGDTVYWLYISEHARILERESLEQKMYPAYKEKSAAVSSTRDAMQ